jgi:hypothetical protein
MTLLNRDAGYLRDIVMTAALASGVFPVAAITT